MKNEKKTTAVFDFKKEYRSLYASANANPCFIDVPPFKTIELDGVGDPNCPEFQEKVQVLYGLAYTIKFLLKKSAEPFDFVVPPLSGLWDAHDVAAFTENRKAEWRWTIMIPMPDRVTEDVFATATAELRRKKNPLHLPQVRFRIFEEGLCAQILHVGPYSAEAPTIKKLHDFFLEEGYQHAGKHHEIYIGDPRRGDLAKLKTIIRQPVRKP